MKKILCILLCVTMLMGLFTACSSTTQSSQSGTGSETTTNSTETQGSNSEDRTDDGQPKYGGILKFASHLTVPNSGYTPEMTSNSTLVYLSVAYESLITYNEDGEVTPHLATDWTIDADEPSITWTLRENVKFADGEPFNAEAVKRNVEEYQKVGRSEVSNVASMEIIDEYTIKMNLQSWNSSTFESVGYFVYYMSPKALEDIETLRKSSCGTGPFQIVEFTPGVSAKYKKNENYWQEGKPYLDGVEIYAINEPTTTAMAFKNNEYDMILMNSLPIAKELLDSGQFIMQSNKSGRGLVGTGLIPNSISGPFADPKVRQAMCYAIDEEALVKTFGYGLLETTNQWAKVGSPTYNPDVKGYPYNPEKAKELLAEAGYPNGFDTVMYTVAGNKDMFTAAANMLTEVGIRCTVNLIDEPTQVNLYSTGTWEGIMGHFHSISPDLGLFMGRHLDPTGAFYAKGIQHPQESLDLLEAVRSAPTEEEKRALEWELQALIYDELALFGKPLYISNEPVFKYDYVKGDNMHICHYYSWEPANTWLDK